MRFYYKKIDLQLNIAYTFEAVKEQEILRIIYKHISKMLNLNKILKTFSSNWKK